MDDDRLQQLISEIKNLSAVRVREPIDVQSAALGYEFEPLDADAKATALEAYGRPGEWIIFVEDGQFETTNGAAADSQLEHALWGVLAFGAREWRRFGSRYWEVNTDSFSDGNSTTRRRKPLRTRAPIYKGSEEILPAYISVEYIRQLRFYA